MSCKINRCKQKHQFTTLDFDFVRCGLKRILIQIMVFNSEPYQPFATFSVTAFSYLDGLETLEPRND